MKAIKNSLSKYIDQELQRKEKCLNFRGIPLYSNEYKVVPFIRNYLKSLKTLDNKTNEILTYYSSNPLYLKTGQFVQFETSKQIQQGIIHYFRKRAYNSIKIIVISEDFFFHVFIDRRKSCKIKLLAPEKFLTFPDSSIRDYAKQIINGENPKKLLLKNS